MAIDMLRNGKKGRPVQLKASDTQVAYSMTGNNLKELTSRKVKIQVL